MSIFYLMGLPIEIKNNPDLLTQYNRLCGDSRRESTPLIEAMVEVAYDLKCKIEKERNPVVRWEVDGQELRAYPKFPGTSMQSAMFGFCPSRNKEDKPRTPQ